MKGVLMATDPKKRQKKLERLAAKRKAKQQHLIQEKSAGLPERLAAAASHPVLHTWATMDLWDQGLGWVCLSRQLPNGSVAFAVFLVDRYCLGVKDVLTGISHRSEYDSQIVRKVRSEFAVEELAPEAVRKLIESAVEYARRLGLSPHRDFQRARLLFGTIDAAECMQEFEFGKNGKPLFVAGPHDTPARCRQILSMLESSCGPDGFHYILPVGGATEFLPESLRQGGARLIGKDEGGQYIDQRLEFNQAADRE
jgi:hypothetical protein